MSHFVGTEMCGGQGLRWKNFFLMASSHHHQMRIDHWKEFIFYGFYIEWVMQSTPVYLQLFSDCLEILQDLRVHVWGHLCFQSRNGYRYCADIFIISMMNSITKFCSQTRLTPNTDLFGFALSFWHMPWCFSMLASEKFLLQCTHSTSSCCSFWSKIDGFLLACDFCFTVH